MRRLIITLCITLAPTLAWAEPQITGVELETTEPEVRVVVNLDPPTSAPAHRLMRDDNSLRLRFVDVTTEGMDEQFEDETLRRVRVVNYRGRVIVRMDPRRASAVDLLERAEVQPHPRGVVVVLQRSDREVSRYRDAHSPSPAQNESNEEEDDAQEETEDTEATPDEASPGATSTESTPSTSDGQASSSTPSSPRSEQNDEEPSQSAAATSDPIRAGVAVAFVLFLGGIAWYLRRRRVRGVGSGAVRSIDVVAAKRIGPRQSLLLVEAGGQTLLVGTTEKGMVRLATLGEQEAEQEATPLDEELHIATDEELALPRLRGKAQRELTPLERELRKPMMEEKKTTFKRELESEGARISGWANLLSARGQKKPTIGIETPPTPSTAAVEGLLRLRQMADDSTSMVPQPRGNGQVNGRVNGHINGHINGTKPNGKDKSLAALESLLTSRQAN